MGGIRRCAGWLAALIAVGVTPACHDEPKTANSMVSALPKQPTIHTELHRRQLVEQLIAIERSVQAADELPTMCRLPTRDLADVRALVVTRRMLGALAQPGASVPEHDARLNATPFGVLADAAHGFDEGDRAQVDDAIERIYDRRYLAVVRVGRHRAPARRGDRNVSPGRLLGEVVLVDTEDHTPLCRGEIDATTSSSMNAYGELDESAFARDLGVNFLRAVEAQLERATGGMKIVWNEEGASPRLASHGASAPSASPP